ncbi:MAG TPA: hypothetical protein VKR43_23475 [Bryobacteraceae bacterium]|nr:hypothetical protein [Bryobacteraceae bacterium]
MSAVRTTVRLEDGLLEQAKREAARRGETLTALIEEGLRLVLIRGQKPAKRRRVMIPVSNTGGGLLPGIDLDNSAALLDLMEPPGEEHA